MANDPIHDAHVVCIRCGYNLSATPLGGNCPECGTPVADSLERPLPTSGYAIASLIIGILALFACACYGVPSLIFGGLAISYGNRARKQVHHHEAGGSTEGLATAGTICGWIGVIVGLVAVIGVIIMVIVENM